MSIVFFLADLKSAVKVLTDFREQVAALVLQLSQSSSAGEQAAVAPAAAGAEASPDSDEADVHLK